MASAKFVVGDFPSFGLLLLLSVMIAASYTFATSLAAGASGRMKTLQAARLGAYGTVALIAVAVLCLAYAFVSHDFRLRYVAHYSDRSMPTAYLLTALWGGQDGSLLWWLFLLSLYIGVCVFWLGKKYLELQPYILATLMGIVLFFCVLMAFAANPFATGVGGARADGEGLNPLLQNFYMIIHPPSLYTGFVGCSIPFAFGMAALATGRLDAEWIQACRKFTLFALMFLAIGNGLGMIWAYEELGWGGYWAWDPVENAAFMPLLSLAAFTHSVMIQERRGMLKVWNIFLICLTFFMTIFGTFLTRSGLIASVHSFAQSSIGDYFLYFLALLAGVCATMIMYRWPELRDLPPSPKFRRGAIVAGWTTIVLTAPGLVSLTGKIGTFGAATRVTVFALSLGLAVFASIELFTRITQGKNSSTKRPQIESLFSREFTFLLNNWGLLGMMVFILVATVFPRISEVLWNENVTVGPPFYNAWLQPLGLGVFALMGIGTLFGWKKTSDTALRRAFRIPGAVFVGTVLLHFALGKSVGYPAVVWAEPIYGGALGQALRGFNAFTPVLGLSLVTFNFAVVAQEFYFLYRSRVRTNADHTPKWLWYAGLLPGFVYSIVSLPATGRRRYGGYVVHFGICLAFLGWTGKSWNIDKETVLSPGQTYQVERYTLEYVGPRMEVDNNKRMVFADIRVLENGTERGRLNPAKFIYKKMPESPTTEVSMLHSVRDDLYLVVGSINPETKVATLQVHLNKLVLIIWLGVFGLIPFGCFVCMWPEFEPEESRAWHVVKGMGAVTTSIILGVFLALLPVPAFAQSTASQHAGSIQIDNPKEKRVFSQLRCMCGTCPREMLSSCACSTADDTRAQMRARLAKGDSPDQIIDDYVKEYGSAALAIPPDSGGMRAIYAVPIVALVGSGVGLALLLKKWRANAQVTASASTATNESPAKRDAYDDKIDAELRDLDV